jgi:hypothetical protein
MRWLLKPKGEKDRSDNQGVRDKIVPFHWRSKKSKGDDCENDQGDAFLKNFQLRHGPLLGANSVGRNLENIFKEGDAPAQEDHQPQSLVSEFQMPVPGEIHEDVG